MAATRVRDGVALHPSVLPDTFKPQPGSISEIVISQTLAKHARGVEAMHKIAQATHPGTQRLLIYIAGMTL